MTQFHVYFFWEQERTDLGYTKDYIVPEASAAPILDNTERSGIAADHRGMCKFEDSQCHGFRTVAATLQRFAEEAPQDVETRTRRALANMDGQRYDDAIALLGGAQNLSTCLSTGRNGSGGGMVVGEWHGATESKR